MIFRLAPSLYLRVVRPNLFMKVVDLPLEGRLVVAACESSGGIGHEGRLPWPHLRKDMQHFKAVTDNSAVLMGSGTYKSLPDKVRPLPNRLNIVLSNQTRTQLSLPDSVLLANSLDAASELLLARGHRVVYVTGGESVFKTVLERPEWSARVHLTVVHKEFDCDRFFPISTITDPNGAFTEVSSSTGHSDSGVNYTIREYVRNTHPEGTRLVDTRHEECQYLALIKRVLRTGVTRGDRTGTGTISLFGEQMRFSLRESFPLLTTKRVFWRGVAEELFWFIRGCTDANQLSSKGVRIWDGNGSRQFLDARGFPNREVGDLGPVYGFQWRHFGAKYLDMHADYDGQGVDQLAEVINTLRKNPNDRRMLMSAWNPTATNEMALPPCHVLVQFYVANGELSAQMYQRSCDMGLGVPFNIASYALLTCLIAEVTGLKRGDFVHVLGDAHVYSNHVEALLEQVEREPRPFPTLSIRHRENIEEFCFDDLSLENYNPHETIRMKMAV